MMKGEIVERQLDIIDGSVTTIKRDLKSPGAADVHVLTNYMYMDKIKSLEVKLEGLEKEIVFLDDFRRHLEKASHI